MKVSLKIGIFLWYLRGGFILTKDNLVKRNWHGSKKYFFRHHDETIKHLFFECKFARAMWAIIQVASNIYQPRAQLRICLVIDCMELHLITRKHFLVGVAALCWSLWLCRNDIIFDKKKIHLRCRLSTRAHTGCTLGAFAVS